MNERILELAAEAEDYADSIVDQGGEFHPAYTQKFAELIVKECINIADRNDGESNDEWDECARYISAIIKKYLGAEQ